MPVPASGKIGNQSAVVDKVTKITKEPMKKTQSTPAPHIRSVPTVTNMVLESDSESVQDKAQDRKMSALKEENKQGQDGGEKLKDMLGNN